MKSIALALVLLATPAFAGVYDYTETAYQVAGTTEIQTFQRNLAAGGVSDGNVLRWRGTFQGDGTARFLVGGVEVESVDIYGTDVVVDIEIRRSGTSQASVRLWTAESADGGIVRSRGHSGVAGLAWNTQQSLEIRLLGTSPAGSVAQMFAGFEK